MSKYVQDIDRGFNQILKDLEFLERADIDVGVQSDTMADGGKMTMAKLAAVHEFGAEIKIDAGSVTQYRSVGKDGNFKHGGKLRKRKLKSTNFAQTFARKAHSIQIPERSFIRSAFDENQKEIENMAKGVANKVAGMELSPKQGMHLIGQDMEKKIKQKLKKGPFEANAPATVKRKGSSRPLIDTGRLRNSIRYKVK